MWGHFIRKATYITGNVPYELRLTLGHRLYVQQATVHGKMQWKWVTPVVNEEAYFLPH